MTGVPAPVFSHYIQFETSIIATFSIWYVWQNKSKGCIDSILAPLFIRIFKSLASVAGLQLTYIIFDLVSFKLYFKLSIEQPFLGGSKIVTSKHLLSVSDFVC